MPSSGVEGHHDNCTDNLFAGMAALGLTPPEVPSPLNLFMNIPWAADGTLGFAAPPKPDAGRAMCGCAPKWTW